MDNESLQELRKKLVKLLPDSIQVYNLVTLALSDDGIERKVIVSDDNEDDIDTLAVIVVNRIESPKESVTLYCRTGGLANIKKLLRENIDLDREITFAERHVQLLSNTWKFSSAGTQQMISQLTKLNRVFGLFKDQDLEPLAWMLIYSDGSLGMLHTREEERCRGLGSFLMKSVVEEALKLGLVPCVHIEDDNEISKRFFEKYGFQRGDFTQWIFHKP